MTTIIDLIGGTVSNIISVLNNNFTNLKIAFAEKKVMNENLQNAVITTDKIKDGTINNKNLNAVTTDKIANGAITTDKIAGNVITLDKFENNLKTDMSYVRPFYKTTDLNNTQQQFPVGSIVLYYRESPINEKEDINGLQEVSN